jgi:hypothetical protein
MEARARDVCIAAALALYLLIGDEEPYPRGGAPRNRRTRVIHRIEIRRYRPLYLNRCVAIRPGSGSRERS